MAVELLTLQGIPHSFKQVWCFNIDSSTANCNPSIFKPDFSACMDLSCLSPSKTSFQRQVFFQWERKQVIDRKVNNCHIDACPPDGSSHGFNQDCSRCASMGITRRSLLRDS